MFVFAQRKKKKKIHETRSSSELCFSIQADDVGRVLKSKKNLHLVPCADPDNITIVCIFSFFTLRRWVFINLLVWLNLLAVCFFFFLLCCLFCCYVILSFPVKVQVASVHTGLMRTSFMSSSLHFNRGQLEQLLPLANLCFNMIHLYC